MEPPFSHFVQQPIGQIYTQQCEHIPVVNWNFLTNPTMQKQKRQVRYEESHTFHKVPDKKWRKQNVSTIFYQGKDGRRWRIPLCSRLCTILLFGRCRSAISWTSGSFMLSTWKVAKWFWGWKEKYFRRLFGCSKKNVVNRAQSTAFFLFPEIVTAILFFRWEVYWRPCRRKGTCSSSFVRNDCVADCKYLPWGTSRPPRREETHTWLLQRKNNVLFGCCMKAASPTGQKMKCSGERNESSDSDNFFLLLAFCRL